jgi:hypothetical protein
LPPFNLSRRISLTLRGPFNRLPGDGRIKMMQTIHVKAIVFDETQYWRDDIA